MYKIMDGMKTRVLRIDLEKSRQLQDVHAVVTHFTSSFHVLATGCLCSSEGIQCREHNKFY